jgi:hypothetical protein
MFMEPAALAAPPSPATPSAARSIAVSVPPEPTQIGPGQTSKVHVRVVNPATGPVTVAVTGRGLQFGDNGKLTMTDSPDPQWAGRVDFPAGVLTVPAQGYDDVFLTVRMPEQIDPDLYFIGFVVRPLPTSNGRVELINQIGAFVTIDVPGPRVRQLTADLHVPGFDFGPIHLTNLALGSMTSGQFRVRNIGHAAAQFWGWNETRSSFGGTPTQQRIDKSLLPTGRARSFAISAEPAWPIDVVTMKVYVVYPDKTETATAQIVLSKRMLVINPWVVVAAGVLFIAIAGWWLLGRRRRRRPRRVPAHRQARSISSRSLANKAAANR